MTLVAGVDSSTQSCKVVIIDADSGRLIRSGRAPHPGGTEVDPSAWWDALCLAIESAGGLDDVAAIAVAGQQHGMVALDQSGQVIRPAILWNDTRSATDALDLIMELGKGDEQRGRQAWAQQVGSVPVASLTVTKLRWLARCEPRNAARVAAVALPHDWLSWRLAGHGPADGALEALATDRSDASGTGYYSLSGEAYNPALVELALGHPVRLPRVVGPWEEIGQTAAGARIAAGAGDNAAAALGLGLRVGEGLLSVGTSGVVSAISEHPAADASGMVTGFADASGHYLPLVCTLNASRILDEACAVLSVGYERLDQLALAASPGAGGMTLVPYFEGERSPNLPGATASIHGMTLDNGSPENRARASVEALLCSFADCLEVMEQHSGAEFGRLFLIGGGARSRAVRELAPGVLGRPVAVPRPGEYTANGAARQAAAMLASGTVPRWGEEDVVAYESPAIPQVHGRYVAIRRNVYGI